MDFNALGLAGVITEQRIAAESAALKMRNGLGNTAPKSRPTGLLQKCRAIL